MEIRVDPLTGARVVIAGSRQGRPNLPTAGCPFCVGGVEAPEPYEVKAFPNRWPTFPGGCSEVVLYSPEHDATFADLGADGARRVVDLWAERTAALGARPDVAYVLVFENRGPEVGATIAHPHGQIFALDHVPELPQRELDRAAEVGCPLCGADAGDRLVSESEGWRAEVPVASAYPFGLLVQPEQHVPDLPSLDARSRDGLATILVDVTGRLDRLFDEPMPYMLWFHQRPTDGGTWPQAHLHLEVAPILRAAGVQRFVAGGELGSGLMINPIVPDDAAARLRAS
jgi:UDPglucose--hexose-1-phosphate uridylyltransferase